MASDRTARYYVVNGFFQTPFDTDWLKADPVNRGDAPTCGVCGAFVGMLRWLPPRRAEVTCHRGGWGDFAFKGHDFLVSERAKEVLESEALAGLPPFEEVEVLPRRRSRACPHHPPRYFYCDVRRTSTAVDESRSRILRDPPAPSCTDCGGPGIVNAVLGMHIDATTWSGEDLFRPRNFSGTIIASEAFKDAVERHELTNIVFIPTEEYRWDPLRRHADIPQSDAPS